MVKLLLFLAGTLACYSSEPELREAPFQFTKDYSLQARSLVISDSSSEKRFETDSRGCYDSGTLTVCSRASSNEFLFFYEDRSVDQEARILWTEGRYFDENSLGHTISTYPPLEPPLEYEVIPPRQRGRSAFIPTEKRHWEKGADGYDYPILDYLLPWDNRNKSHSEAEAEVKRVADQGRVVAIEIPVVTGEHRALYRFEFMLVRESLADYQRRIVRDN